MSNGIKSDCPFLDTLLFGNGQLEAFHLGKGAFRAGNFSNYVAEPQNGHSQVSRHK